MMKFHLLEVHSVDWLRVHKNFARFAEESLEHFGGMLKRLRAEFVNYPNEKRKAEIMQNQFNRRTKTWREEFARQSSKKRQRDGSTAATSRKNKKQKTTGILGGARRLEHAESGRRKESETVG